MPALELVQQLLAVLLGAALLVPGLVPGLGPKAEGAMNPLPELNRGPGRAVPCPLSMRALLVRGLIITLSGECGVRGLATTLPARSAAAAPWLAGGTGDPAAELPLLAPVDGGRGGPPAVAERGRAGDPLGAGDSRIDCRNCTAASDDDSVLLYCSAPEPVDARLLLLPASARLRVGPVNIWGPCGCPPSGVMLMTGPPVPLPPAAVMCAADPCCMLGLII